MGRRTLIHPMEITTPTKVCTRCGEDKPLTEYYGNSQNGNGYIYGKCKPCYIEVQLQRCYYNRENAPPKPDNCDCCGKPLKAKACYDHDHETGEFRGWLCYNCNSGIGALGDNLEGVLKAVQYLTNV